jgi:hypothetical protein
MVYDLVTNCCGIGLLRACTKEVFIVPISKKPVCFLHQVLYMRERMLKLALGAYFWALFLHYYRKEFVRGCLMSFLFKHLSNLLFAKKKSF